MIYDIATREDDYRRDEIPQQLNKQNEFQSLITWHDRETRRELVIYCTTKPHIDKEEKFNIQSWYLIKFSCCQTRQNHLQLFVFVTVKTFLHTNKLFYVTT